MSAQQDPQIHPGTIHFVDQDTGEGRDQAIVGIPETIAWGTNAEGARVPVVRIVSHMRGAQRVIESYGSDGALLQRTVQSPPPARP